MYVAIAPCVRIVVTGLVELSLCSEPNTDSIECIYLIESVIVENVMEHHNDKEISMAYVQIKPYIQFKTIYSPELASKNENSVA